MTYIPDSLRREVITRANYCCEYCLLPEMYTFKKHEVDHIRATKHGGNTSSENLCLICFECNRHKGSDLSSVDPVTDEVTPLFHPRRNKWSEHFTLMNTGGIVPLTPQGRVTINLLNMNDPERIALRYSLISIGELTIL